MLMWIFGGVQNNEVHIHEHDRASGYLVLEKARVKWFLSINYDVLPKEIKSKGLRTYRSLKIGTEQFEFSGGFTELHTKSYEQILSGQGFGLEEARNAIQIVYDIRRMSPEMNVAHAHEMSKLNLSNHPFDKENRK